MKKLFLLLLACSAFLRPSLHAAGTTNPATRATLVIHVESCEAILRELMAKPETAIHPDVLKAARAIVIVNQFKAGFIVGVQGGYGVIMVKRADGKWSLPALIRANEASLGLQIGGKAVETVYIITDDKTPRLLLSGRFDIGVDAKAVAGPRAAEADIWKDGNLLKIPVQVYSKKSGLYAGTTVKAGAISRDDDANHLLYNTTYNLPELLYSDWVQPVSEVKFLMDYVKKLAP